MTEKEKALLVGCLNGEKAAWDAFVLQYSDLVYHTIKKTFSLYHVEPRRDLVEDLFQEFFLSLLRDDCKKLRQFRGERGCTLASWLRVVAARLVIDHLRTQGTSPVVVPENLRSNEPDPPAALINEEEEKLLSEAIRALSPRDRLIIELAYRRDLPPDEIAGILRASVNAVYTQKSRILSKLRETLGESLRP